MSPPPKKKSSLPRKKRDGLLLFEYGSLCHEKITSVVGDVGVVGGALLSRHTVRFGGSSRTYGGSAVATAVPCNKDKDVLGVVYRLKQEAQLDLLDLFFECHLGLMKRVRRTVHDGRQARAVYMYVLQQPPPAELPRGSVDGAYAELHKALVREGYELYRKQNFEGRRPKSQRKHDQVVHGVPAG